MNGKGGFRMSEKRFTSYYERGNEAVIEDNGKRLSNKKVVDLLNELAEENEQLKEEKGYFERKKCEYFNKYNKKHLDNIQLTEENKQLKQEIIVYKKAFQEQVQRCSL